MKPLKQARQEIKEKFRQTSKTDENGRTMISVSIKDTNDVLSPLSDEDGAVISNDFSDYLDNKVKLYPPKTRLHIKIFTKKEIEKEEQSKITFGIRNHYENEFVECGRERKKQIIVSSLMIMVGILLLGLSFGLSFTPVPSLINLFIEIAGTVFEWEAVSILCFRRSKVVVEQMRALAIMRSEISFGELKHGKNKSEQKTTRKTKDKGV